MTPIQVHRVKADQPQVREFKADMSLFPKWAYLGSLAIPDEGTARKVRKLMLFAPVIDDDEEEDGRKAESQEGA
ncbi:MAG: hypothetical protein IH604_16210 [Burkholderiales bacterium]|nr:hypothetical protein [Burkholderiales bacterium]